MDLLLSVLMDIFSLRSILLLTIGTIIGIIFGSIPGLTATMGVAILLPITFGFNPAEGILLLIGVYVGGISGGLIAATLLGIPGTPSSIATTFDAFPMAKKGEPVRALGIAITASLVGGILSFVVLISAAPVISTFAVKLSPFEYFAITFFALALISVLSKGNFIKGITAGLLGIAVSLIGFAPIDGTARFAFGSMNLNSGVSLLPLMMGLFAISQILIEVQTTEKKQDIKLKVKGLGITIREFYQNLWNMIRSAAIGVGFGMLPGMGSGVSNIVAYAQAKRASKKSDEFGKGIPEGIYASESSNNASIGGALIPLLALGIPGDTVTAILLGGFMIHGIQPGPLLLTQNPDIVQVVFIAFFFAILLVFIFQLFGMRLFPKILMVPKNFLYSIIIVMSVVGAYSDGNNTFDIWVMLAFGLIGFILINNNFPMAPMVLGFVLGPMVEEYFRRAMMSSDHGIFEFFMRPISATFILIAIVVTIFAFVQEVKMAKKKTNVELNS